MAVIRALAPHEVDLHHDLRLRALRDAPDSFRDTAAEAAAWPPDEWARRTRAVAAAQSAVALLAFAGDRACGMCYFFFDREYAGDGRLGGVWVDPAYRRGGVGRALLGAALEWARHRKLGCVRLWAPAAMPAALALYRAAGFVPNGREDALRPGSPVRIVEMEAAP
jgi:GNAT superfamily N-acetyltransferase